MSETWQETLKRWHRDGPPHFDHLPRKGKPAKTLTYTVKPGSNRVLLIRDLTTGEVRAVDPKRPGK